MFIEIPCESTGFTVMVNVFDYFNSERVGIVFKSLGHPITVVADLDGISEFINGLNYVIENESKHGWDLFVDSDKVIHKQCDPKVDPSKPMNSGLIRISLSYDNNHRFILNRINCKTFKDDMKEAYRLVLTKDIMES